MAVIANAICGSIYQIRYGSECASKRERLTGTEYKAVVLSFEAFNCFVLAVAIITTTDVAGVAGVTFIAIVGTAATSIDAAVVDVSDVEVENGSCLGIARYMFVQLR